MAEGMFGGPVGEQAYLGTALKALQVGAGVEHTLGEIAMQPDQARLLRAKAGLAEMQVREEELWQSLAKTAATGMVPQPFIGPPGPQAEQEQALWQETAGRAVTADPLAQMDNLAALAAQRGLTSKALKILEGTAEVRQRRASEATSRSQQALNVLKFLEQDAENMDRAFGWVKSPEDKQRADALYEFQTGKPSPLKNIPYDGNQGIFDGFHQRNLTAKDRVQQAEREAARLGIETHRAARRDQHDVANETARFRAENEATHQAWLRKQGEAKATKPPTARSTPRHILERMEADAGRLLLQNYPGADKIDAEAYLSARANIVAEAASALQRNPALNMSQAVAQAYTNTRGDIEFEQGYFGGMMNAGGKFKFTGGGRTAATALPMPTVTPEQLKDPAKVREAQAALKVGRYYVSPSGQIGRWDGKQFQLVQ